MGVIGIVFYPGIFIGECSTGFLKSNAVLAPVLSILPCIPGEVYFFNIAMILPLAWKCKNDPNLSSG
jgi:hypothetical protein